MRYCAFCIKLSLKNTTLSELNFISTSKNIAIYKIMAGNNTIMLQVHCTSTYVIILKGAGTRYLPENVGCRADEIAAVGDNDRVVAHDVFDGVQDLDRVQVRLRLAFSHLPVAQANRHTQSIVKECDIAEHPIHAYDTRRQKHNKMPIFSQTQPVEFWLEFTAKNSVACTAF